MTSQQNYRLRDLVERIDEARAAVLSTRSITMKMLARGLLFAHNAPAAIAALRDKGYEVLTHTFSDEPNYTFVEAYRDVPVTGDVYAAADEEFNRVCDTIEPFDGSTDDCGPPPDGHVPFAYETPAWRERKENLDA
jgi:hypothetical protein